MSEVPTEPDPTLSAEGLRIAVVHSRFNASVTDRLLAGAQEMFERLGGNPASMKVLSAPGAFELPVFAQAAVASERYEAVVALGCLIQGETRHDRVIADAVAQGLTRVSVETGVPVTFGVLTVQDLAQAEARAGGERGNKGADAMAAAVHAAATMRTLSQPL